MQNAPLGYNALVEHYNLDVIPNYRHSLIRAAGKRGVDFPQSSNVYFYDKKYAPKNLSDPMCQLEFALKYDGINLEILKAFFYEVASGVLVDWIKSRPTGKYCRMAWFLYEFLTEKKLPIKDLRKVKYINLLDEDKYFTSAAIKSSRHGINNNLLGNKHFCPMVRRTAALNNFCEKKLDLRAKEIIKQYDYNTLVRANNYLLAKETMSSYEIEHERPNKNRIAKFMSLIQRVELIDCLTKDILVECQNEIVDHRFVATDYRYSQNYVGENINLYLQKIHFISVKPDDLHELMQGLLDALERMMLSDCNAVIVAAAISFGFVFIHPFEDGNGRLHRFLIHYILHRMGFAPDGITLPVSAIILQNMLDYDRALETFSKPIMRHVTDYVLKDDGVLIVNQDTKNFYQYIDFTKISEYLFSCVEETIDVHFHRELNFLVNYDITKSTIQHVVDMPDRLIDLFIRIVMQNNGKLSSKKRDKYFSFLSKTEVVRLVEIVVKNMQ